MSAYPSDRPMRIPGAVAQTEPLRLSDRLAAANALCIARAADELWMAALCCCPADQAVVLAEKVRDLKAEMVAAVRGVAYADDPVAVADA